MNDYKFTRKEVENLVNSKILPSLRAKHIKGDHVDETMQRADIICFMYSVGRMHALESLLRLAILDTIGIGCEQTIDAKIKNYFKEQKDGKK